MPNFRKIGVHDTGFWDRENKVNANPTPLSEGKNVNEAIAAAKDRAGAELVVVKGDGTASTHAIEGDKFKKEGKHVLISELDRDPRSNSQPLAIDDKVAEAFGGKGAFLVDEKNKVTYLGQDVDVATNKSKLQEAEGFLRSPSAEKVNAAYAIAQDAGNEGHIDKTLGQNVLNQLKENYHGTDAAARDISFLKPGQVQTEVLALTESLSNLAGQENQRVSDLRSELSTRTEEYNTANATATKERDNALGAWKNAAAQAEQKVSQSARVLREKRMPGIHQLEQDLQGADRTRRQAQQHFDSARSARRSAESRINDLEKLPARADAHLDSARRLEQDNRNLYIQMQTYTSSKLSHVRDERRRVEYEYRDVSADLDAEKRKPAPPANGGGGNTGDPFGKDPFGGGSGNNVGSGDDPFGKDPFSGGGGNSGGNDPFGKDPFNSGGGKYRDSGRIRSLESKLNLLESEGRDLRSRERSLENVNTRLALTQSVDQLSLLFGDLSSSDRINLSRFSDKQKRNNREIQNHRQSADRANSQYRREIRGAQQNLSDTSRAEDRAQDHLNQANGTVSQLNRNLDQLKANPRPDNHPEVKGSAQTHQRNLKAQEDTVGKNAPLTQKRDATQQQFDNVQGSYRQDKNRLESDMRNVKQTLNREAQGMIQATEQKIR